MGIDVWSATSLVFSVCNGADVLIGVEAGPVTVELLSCWVFDGCAIIGVLLGVSLSELLHKSSLIKN